MIRLYRSRTIASIKFGNFVWSKAPIFSHSVLRSAAWHRHTSSSAPYRTYITVAAFVATSACVNAAAAALHHCGSAFGSAWHVIVVVIATTDRAGCRSQWQSARLRKGVREGAGGSGWRHEARGSRQAAEAGGRRSEWRHPHKVYAENEAQRGQSCRRSSQSHIHSRAIDTIVSTPVHSGHKSNRSANVCVQMYVLCRA